MKRLFDIVASAVALVLLAPLLAAVAVLVTVGSRGPALYRTRRVGRGGKLFTLYKFRTMRSDAPSGPAITTAGDSRVTVVGGFLRRAKLDEIPQLFNVLIGDMSLVGPRPEDAKYVALYSNEQRKVLNARPGMTSVASIAYRSEEQLLSGPDWEQRYINTIMPDKLRLELEYLDRQSFWADLQVIARTAGAILR